MKTQATCNLRYNENIRMRVMARPDSYPTENITANDLQEPIPADENANSLSAENVCSPLQVRSYVFFSSIRACKPPNAFRQKDDSRSTPLANAMEENRRNMKAIDLRSRRFQQGCSAILNWSTAIKLYRY